MKAFKKCDTLEFTAIIGLCITVTLHILKVTVTDITLSHSWNAWLGVYCAWIGIYFAGLGRRRQKQKSKSEG